MSIQRAVITAAAPDQKSLPLQTLVDRQGQSKSALELILEECVEAGAEEICVVVCPGSGETFARAAGQHANRLTFIEQDNPKGYGDALYRAKDFVGKEPFLHLSRDGNRDDTFDVTTVVEKPTPTRAEQDLIVAGLRASHYLCFSGMHVLTSSVMDLLEEAIKTSDGPVQLSAALHKTAQRERYLALRVQASRYNIGEKYGLLKGQLALALSGKDRDDILSELLGLVATTTCGEA